MIIIVIKLRSDSLPLSLLLSFIVHNIIMTIIRSHSLFIVIIVTTIIIVY